MRKLFFLVKLYLYEKLYERDIFQNIQIDCVELKVNYLGYNILKKFLLSQISQIWKSEKSIQ